MTWQASDSQQSLMIRFDSITGTVTRIRGVGLPWRTPNGATLGDTIKEFLEKHPDAKETPQRAGSDKGGGAEGVAPLTYPPSSPVVSDAAGFGEDPIKLIQTMIHEAHYALTMEVEKLMVDHENKLRLQIKQVLRRHASGVDLRPSPLDQVRAYPASQGDNEQG